MEQTGHAGLVSTLTQFSQPQPQASQQLRADNWNLLLSEIECPAAVDYIVQSIVDKNMSVTLSGSYENLGDKQVSNEVLNLGIEKWKRLSVASYSV